MKKVLCSLSIIAMLGMITAPVMAVEVTNAEQAADNINRGVKNVDWAWTEVMQHSGQEASKATGAADQLTAVFAGGVIGARAGIHRLGAGAIDLLTFWIPKTESFDNEPMMK
ncbi:MAG: hypothetical protein ACI9CF_000300 [Candidatus Omnitrophota bacterium]|jgi:hypothetical protein